MYFIPDSKFFSSFFFEGKVIELKEAVKKDEQYVLQYVGYHTDPECFNYILAPTEAYQDIIENKNRTDKALYIRDNSADFVIPNNRNIKEICIAKNDEITSIDLSECHDLERLIFVNNQYLHTIKGFESLHNLQELAVGFNCLSDIPNFEEILNNNPDLKLNIDVAFVPELKRRHNNFWELAEKIGFIEEVNSDYITKINNVFRKYANSKYHYTPVSLCDLKLIDETITNTITNLSDFNKNSLGSIEKALCKIREKLYNPKVAQDIDNMINVDKIANPYLYLEEPIMPCCLLRSSVIDNDTICQGSSKHAQYFLSSLGIPAIRIFKYGHVIAAFQMNNEWFGAECTAEHAQTPLIQYEEELKERGFVLPSYLKFAKKQKVLQKPNKSISYERNH